MLIIKPRWWRKWISVQAEVGLNPGSNSGFFDSDSHSFLVGQWAFSIKAVMEATFLLSFTYSGSSSIATKKMFQDIDKKKTRGHERPISKSHRR